MIRRIGILCLLVMCILWSMCSAYNSGITENRRCDLENNTYNHSYYITVDFSHLYTPYDISCRFTKEFRIDNYEESIGKYIDITMRKTSRVHTLYYPRKIEFSAEGVHYLTLVSPTYERYTGDVKEPYTNATFYMYTHDFQTLQRLFQKEGINIKMRVYDVNGQYYDYFFNIEQKEDIKKVLFA